MEEPKTKLENVIRITDEQIEEIMQKERVDEIEASNMYLHAVYNAYLDHKFDVDVLDLAIAFTLLGKAWPDEANARVFHDIYQSPYFKECMEDIGDFSDGICPQLNLPVGLAEKYLDYLFKKGNESIDTFLLRCLCIGCFPDSAFLRLTEEEMRETFTDEVEWIIFGGLLDMDDEQIEEAIHLSEGPYETEGKKPNGTSEA